MTKIRKTERICEQEGILADLLAEQEAGGRNADTEKIHTEADAAVYRILRLTAPNAAAIYKQIHKRCL